MEAWHVLIDILIVLSAAFLLGSMAEFLKQNAIIGYLLAGMFVGPYGFHLIVSHENMKFIAEMGVAMLLFSIGLEFSFQRLRSLGSVATIGGTFQVLITATFCAVILALLGFDWKLAVFIGAMAALSSTASVLRLLFDRTALDSIYGRNALGILLLQDIAVLPLTLFLTMIAGRSKVAIVPFEVVIKVTIIAIVIAGFYVAFGHLIPRLLSMRPWGGNRELPTLLAILMAMGAAMVAHQLGISPAIGAFMAGLLVAGSPFAIQVRADIGPLRAILVTLFFASIGMLTDFTLMARYWHLVLAAVLAVILCKTLIIWGIVRILGIPLGMSLATGVCLSQIGEFSFVLADLGLGKIIDDQTFRFFVAVTIITMVVTPYLISGAPTLAAWIERWRLRQRSSPAKKAKAALGPSEAAGESDHVESTKQQDGLILIIGFGPSGERVAEALIACYPDRLGIIDMNPKNASKAERLGLHMHIGDASQAEVLEHAGIHQAQVAIITLPDTSRARRVIQLCRDLKPGIRIIARARYHRFSGELKQAGAEVVIDEEDQVGLKLAAEAEKVYFSDTNP